jgi:2OG-Fe(II) oxygenase superfamily
MNKNEIAPGIVIYNDVIPDGENLYNDIEEAMESAQLPWVQARVQEGNDTPDTVNTMSRDTLTFGVPYLGGIKDTDVKNAHEVFFNTLNNIFFTNFDPIERDYKSMYQIESIWHDQWGVLKYGEGQKFVNHIDDHPEHHRRISTLYYINDNYSGGEINFPRFNISHKPKANQMILFPSTYVYNHSVSPVTEGTRYSVVSWLR